MGTVKNLSIIISKSNSFETSIPLVVVGAGACGLTAALSAREKGVEVVVIEKDKTPHGTTSMSQGTVCAAGTNAQRSVGIEDSPEKFYSDVMKKVNGRTDKDLVRLVTSQAGPMIDWISDKYNIPFSVDTSWKGLGHSVQRLHAPPQKSGEDLLGRLLKATEDAGVTLITGANVKSLYANDSGKVKGVLIERPNGNIEKIGLDSIVLATCGFANNEEMIKEFIPEMEDARVFTWENSNGDGIKWGMELGGIVSDMTSFQGYGALAYPHQLLFNYNYIIDGGFMVNTSGDRFSDEVADVSGQGLKVMEQEDKIAYIIYDEELHKRYFHLNESKKAIEVGAVYKANSISDFSVKFKLPLSRLEKTLYDVSEFKKGIRQDPWGRSFEHSHILKPPYYGIRVTGAIYHTQGGLEVNSSAQVKDNQGGVLPNVFAGGGVARGMSGPTCSGYMPAAGLCMAMTLGRIAGANAAKII
ncbi:MAG: hypothetical protein CBC47_05950 [Alphaproteobacteria bacterium TMED87]|nr:3-ketosteroid dehydrogenase [Rhodospirillaceae bacterium]OUV09182.1 MAG: hypothetical protein CBC47_05950 [Alphaproteobacteria bacterium TMED87]